VNPTLQFDRIGWTTDLAGSQHCSKILYGHEILESSGASILESIPGKYHEVQSSSGNTTITLCARNVYLWRKRLVRETLPLLLFTVLGFLVMGYHPGFEDDGIYLTAIKADLNPALFPHDSDFFRLQTQATVFDGWMAHFVSWTGIPVPWAELLWQFATLFLILWASRRIAAHFFPEVCAQWAAVAMVAAMFTLPVAGTALNIADQHLHPRNLATALILIAVYRILKGKRWQALPLLIVAFLLHPMMAAFGLSFCAFLTLALLEPAPFRLRAAQGSLAAAAPLGWIFAPASLGWHEALASRTYYSIYRWAWYEWLGALAPLFLFWLLWRVAERRNRDAPNPIQNCLSRFALAVFAYGVFQQMIAMLLLGPPSLVRLTPLQPMRFLQLVYLFMALVAGGLLGRFLLKRQIGRWAVYLLVINGGMFLAQWELIDDGAHLELPTVATANPWLQAFEWIRRNTPTSAYFALDPRYLAEPGEGYHNFRALAERSQLADGIKDTAVVMQVPSLAPTWHEQELAQAGWPRFELGDFERLKAQFGVDWVLVKYPQPPGLRCRWHNDTLTVCQLP
jgi:hypothetical protein